MNTTRELERMAYGVEDLIALLGVSRSTAYEMVRTGRIRSVKVGTRYLIPRVAIEEFLGRKEAA